MGRSGCKAIQNMVTYSCAHHIYMHLCLNLNLNNVNSFGASASHHISNVCRVFNVVDTYMQRLFIKHPTIYVIRYINVLTCHVRLVKSKISVSLYPKNHNALKAKANQKLMQIKSLTLTGLTTKTII